MVKILVVEDDVTIQDMVAYNLERDGYEVITKSDGAEGLEAARNEQPDLIVLDLMLPKMSGLDVCRILRPEYSMPIIMLTARDNLADKIQGLELGADDYLTKPFSMRELRARVQAALRREDLSGQSTPHPKTESSSLVAGDIFVNLIGHEVQLDGKKISMRPREFDLLEYLIRHAGQALTREMILESVWGYSYPGTTRTVDVHIRWLREKLEKNPAKPVHILTIRSLGYKFVA